MERCILQTSNLNHSYVEMLSFEAMFRNFAGFFFLVLKTATLTISGFHFYLM